MLSVPSSVLHVRTYSERPDAGSVRSDFVILAFVGGTVGVDILLGWADFGNAWDLNLKYHQGLLCFSKQIAKWTKNYFEKEVPTQSNCRTSLPPEKSSFPHLLRAAIDIPKLFLISLSKKADRFHLLSTFFTPNRLDPLPHMDMFLQDSIFS